MRVLGTALTVMGLAAVAGCNRHAPKPLRIGDNAAAVCDPGQTPLVATRPDGRFTLSHGVFDSTELVQAIENVVPPRPNKTVMVDVDSAHAAALPWIVAAIRAAGGHPVRPDPNCLVASATAWSAQRTAAGFIAGLTGAGH